MAVVNIIIIVIIAAIIIVDVVIIVSVEDAIAAAAATATTSTAVAIIVQICMQMVIVVRLAEQQHITVIVRNGRTKRRFGIIFAIFHIVQLFVGVIVERKIGRTRWTESATVMVCRINGTTFTRTKT